MNFAFPVFILHNTLAEKWVAMLKQQSVIKYFKKGSKQNCEEKDESSDTQEKKKTLPQLSLK